MAVSQINKSHGVQEPDDAPAFAGAVQNKGLMLHSGAVVQKEAEAAVAKTSEQPEIPAAPAALPDSEEAEGTPTKTKTFSVRSCTGEDVARPPGIPLPADVPSRGSVLHTSGSCQPCCWFWRPGSCQNGIECGHCHLCPEHEIKVRRKQKNTMMRRVGSATPKAQAPGDEPHWIADISFPTDLLQEPQKVNLGEVSAFSSESSAHDATPGCDGNPMQPRKVSCPSSTGMVPMRSEGWGGGGSDKSAASHSRMMAFLEEQRDFEAPGDMADADTAEPHGTKAGVGHKGSKPNGLAESVGSALHGTGQCRPCAWYWRPGSCKHGAECNHCHMCGEGEVKLRRKGKQAALRSGSALQRTPSEVSFRDRALGHQTFGEKDTTTTASGSEDEVASSGGGSTGENEKSGNKCSSDGKQPEAKTRLGSFVSLPPGLQVPPGTPSHGSTLHNMGNCWPCSQFWKASGCPNDSACGYCHLCPEGEMKLRKRSRKAMMRLGLCSPKVDSAAQRDTPNRILPFDF
eukprot:CAMPEP_0203944448 /NCGR_PEP_ID=MMETSP0359-20131031/80204_1 /ASSEMBLY_ACC=CAM_ASM_000338 /TAXON_ID=268821 /ORGANISM="Scrippsiella Hangoei, Strain SHTV-5" /LENGTH=513 /DNA_ID=CAMNT_0050875469 /DNA_START=23 /DNA_END=1564 /DNA_ORIENTATION=-